MGNCGILLMMGHAGFISSTVGYSTTACESYERMRERSLALGPSQHQRSRRASCHLLHKAFRGLDRAFCSVAGGCGAAGFRSSL